MKKNQDGMIVVFVVVIIGIISILYASIYVLIGIENNIYNSIGYRTKAYYVAESGAERGLAMVKRDITSPFSSENPFSMQYSEEHRYDVTIENDGFGNYTITSIGRYANTTRKVVVVVKRTDTEFNINSWKEVN